VFSYLLFCLSNLSCSVILIIYQSAMIEAPKLLDDHMGTSGVCDSGRTEVNTEYHPYPHVYISLLSISPIAFFIL
jgi:hypothetical protein